MAKKESTVKAYDLKERHRKTKGVISNSDHDYWLRKKKEKKNEEEAAGEDKGEGILINPEYTGTKND